MTRHDAERPDSSIAIIGMGCMFPRARNLKEFWRVIRRGEDGITETPPTHWAPADYLDTNPAAPDMTYCGRGGFLSPTPFDPTEFGIPPNILEATDTSQLLGLVVAKAALEDAGYGEEREFNRDRASVILGVTGLQELALPLGARLGHPIWRQALSEAGIEGRTAEEIVARIADGYVGWQENSFPGLLGNVIAGRIANRLNLRGTNCVVDAACASSLSATHLAMLELGAGRCDMALAGGVDTLNDIFMYMCFSKTPALSPTGDARPFAADADGTVLGEGIGMLVLKRLADAQRDGDRIYAVIRAMGTSSDGRSQSIYAPHSGGQARALRDAYREAGIEPDEVELIEAHGTGTKVGDAVEFEALKTVFREAASDGTWCALGSIKSQIGHTKAAAGAAGLIKAALAIHHRSLPPTIKVASPNPKMGIDDSPFYLSTELRPWVGRKDRPRRAGVSSFGFGGSNFHAVLEEHEAALPEPAWDGTVEIIALSAETREEVAAQLDGWLAAIGAESFDTAQLAYQAMESRRAFSTDHQHRLVIVAEHEDDLARLVGLAKEKLAAEARAWSLTNIRYGIGHTDGKVAMLFPGQGSQYVAMGRDLACTFPEMTAVLAAGNSEVEDGEAKLSEVVYPRPAFDQDAKRRQADLLRKTQVAQPAIGAVSIGMYRVLERFGVLPDMVGGHSYGELVALCAAGCFDEATLFSLSRLRGRLMAQGDGERGAMLAVSAPLNEIARMIDEERLDLVIANRNGPRQGVLSGPREEIGRAAQAAQARGLATKPLAVSGAFHSSLMESAVGPFRQALEAVPFEIRAIHVFANCTGGPYSNDPSAARNLLAQQIVTPISFVEQIENMHDAGARLFIEVGPGAVVTGLTQSILGRRQHEVVALDASVGRRSGVADLARVLALLAAEGHGVDLTRWEKPAAQPRKPKMVVPLVGANYRANPASAAERRPMASDSARDRRKEMPATSVDAIRGSTDETMREEASLSIPEASSVATTDPARKAKLAESLRLVQEGLRAMQELQQKTAAAHQKFLEGQEQAHRAIQQLLETQQQLQGAPSGVVAGATPAPALPARKRAAVSDELGRDSELREIRGAGNECDPQPTRAPAATTRPAAASLPISNPKRVANNATTSDVVDVEAIVLAVVCEKTGYPREMVELDMDIEADLGIDSIKRVEILAATEEKIPGFGGVKPEQMGGIRTLRQIVEFIQSSTAPGAAPQPARSAAFATAGSAATIGLAPDEFGGTLLEIVSQLTGYPREMIDLDMDLEADLGIDSIKRVEILAAVEARVPGLPAVKPEHMGSLRTLKSIVEYCIGKQSVSASPKSAKAPVAAVTIRAPMAVAVLPAEPAGVRKSRASGIDRSILTAIQLPPAEEGRLRIAEGRDVWVTDDGTDLATHLVREFAAAGCEARIIPAAGFDMGAATKRPGGLIFLAPPSNEDKNIWSVEAETLAKSSFEMVQSVAEDLNIAAKAGSAILATVSRMDGRFGLGGGAFDPMHGSLAGLVKTAAIEWPEVQCRAIDVASNWGDTRAAAKAIVRELACDGPVEVGLDATGRCGLRLVPTESKRGEVGLNTGDVVIVTGGARGVTAEAALALARTCRPTLVLVGRSPAPSDEPEWLAGLTDESIIKKAIVENEFARAKPRPAEVKAAFERHMANRQVRASLARIAAAGSRVEYRSVDIRDEAAVREMVAAIRKTTGPVRGVVHGAGVLEDRRIEDKTREQFDRVFDTKVAGLRHLLGALDLAELRQLVLFSSVSGRFGNAGQCDYAMANEAMNKAAQRLAGAQPTCRVRAISWGPWDGGMVNDALRRQFAERDVGLIPMDAGAECLIEEMRSKDRDCVEVVRGSGLNTVAGTTPSSSKCAPARPAAMTVAFERRLDLQGHPFLRSHVLAGRPVLPLAMMMEWLGHGALHANPGLVLTGLEEVRVLKGVVVRDEAPTIRVAAGRARRSGDEFRVEVELRSGDDDRPIVHVRANALLASRLHAAPPAASWDALCEQPYVRGVEGAYGEVLFHGEMLRGIEAVLGCGERGIAARLRPAPSPSEWMHDPLRSDWLCDPLILDGCFQLSILWCHEEMGAVSLPSYVRTFRRFVRACPTEGVTAALAVRERTRHRMICDVDLIMPDGALAARLEGFESTADESLMAAFGRAEAAQV